MGLKQDIKVLFRRYSDEVQISTTETGEILLFNHNNISRCPAGVFTGIDFESQKGIIPVTSLISGSPVQTMFWQKHIALRCTDNGIYAEPIAVVSFTGQASGIKYTGHLIELSRRR